MNITTTLEGVNAVFTQLLRIYNTRTFQIKLCFDILQNHKSCLLETLFNAWMFTLNDIAVVQ